MLRRSAAQRSAAQRNATQRNAAQGSATQLNATQRSAAQRSAAQRSATQRNATQRNTIQYSGGYVFHVIISRPGDKFCIWAFPLFYQLQKFLTSVDCILVFCLQCRVSIPKWTFVVIRQDICYCHQHSCTIVRLHSINNFIQRLNCSSISIIQSLNQRIAMPYMAPLVYVSICLVQLCIVFYGHWPEYSFYLFKKNIKHY